MSWIKEHSTALGVAFAGAVGHYWLVTSEKFAQKSMVEILQWGLRRHFKRKNKMISKSLYSGPAGGISVSESGGVVSLSGSLSVGAGGGSAKGFAAASVSVSLSIHAEQLADMGLDILSAKFPALAPEIALVKAALDAELAKT